MGQHRTALPETCGAGRSPRPTRAALLAALLAAGAVVATFTLGRQTLQAWPGPGASSAEAALLAVALSASTILTGWVSLVLTLVASELVRRDGLPSGRSTPRAVRWTSAALVAVTATPTPAALAGPPEPAWTSVSSDSVAGLAAASEPGPPPEQRLLPDGSAVPQPGWTPAPSPPHVTPTGEVGLVSTAPREALPEHVVVRAGDTLWAIAARHLGPAATVQDVAEEWPRWYTTNRGTIGPDPDLILPGQELRIPGPGTAPPAAANGEGAGR